MIGILKGTVRIGGVLAAGLAVAAFGVLAAGEGGKGDEGNYVGAAKCKNCHRSSKAGNQFGAWQKMGHAKAYELLASDEAKKIAKEKGIDDPQKNDKCLKCHVTASGVPAARLAKKFDAKQGVQCEACHGPGDKHVKARLAAAGEEEDAGDVEKPYVKIPEGEIVVAPAVDACLTCHNSESPTFKGLCVQKVAHEVMHLDPRKKRTDADVAAEKKKWAEALAAKNAGCGGPEKCEECKKAAK